ncbi:hypothetical protein [Colwellia sp. MEBiC06753]
MTNTIQLYRYQDTESYRQAVTQLNPLITSVAKFIDTEQRLPIDMVAIEQQHQLHLADTENSRARTKQLQAYQASYFTKGNVFNLTV